jgi:hypothetical protein
VNIVAEDIWEDEKKPFNWRRAVMIGLAVIMVLGSFMVGGNVACSRGGGHMAGFSCVEVTNYGVCEAGDELLIIEVGGEPVGNAGLSSAEIDNYNYLLDLYFPDRYDPIGELKDAQEKELYVNSPIINDYSW